MEALTAVATAALTVYDMCKAVDKDMVIDQIRLVHKVGGKSGEYRRAGEAAPASQRPHRQRQSVAEPVEGARRG